jgi:hypothetical protein
MPTYGDLLNNNIVPVSEHIGELIQNGTYYKNEKLYPDFYPGGSYFYAVMGFISKNLIFYSQTIIMIINSVLLYFTIRNISRILYPITTGLYTLTFLVAPVIIWFGRGSFTEPVALLFLLLLINLVSTKNTSMIILAICFISSYTARIDYLLMLLLGIIVIMWNNRKIGCVYTIATILEVTLFKVVYSVYYSRIVKYDMKILAYGVPLLILCAIAGFTISKWGKNFFLKIVYSKYIKYLLFLFGGVCAALMFLDNIVPKENYSFALIHGEYIRTFSENVIDLISMSFPSIVLTGGLLGTFKLVDKSEISISESIILLGLQIPFSYLLLGGMNSPQLYWLLRRYYNVIIPITFISFCFFFRNLKNSHGMALSLICFMLSLNLFLNSSQTVDYKELDKEVIKIEDKLKSEGVNRVFYQTNIKRDISPLFSFSDIEFIPIFLSDYLNIVNEGVNMEGTALLVGNDYNGIISEAYDIQYYKMGENYGELPQKTYDKTITLNRATPELLSNVQYVFHKDFSKPMTGMYNDFWTSSNTIIEPHNIDTAGKDELIIRLLSMSKIHLDGINVEDLNLQIILNDNIIVKDFSYMDNSFRFNINQISSIKKIQICCNTFSPLVEGINDDSRRLGIAIHSIYIK